MSPDNKGSYTVTEVTKIVAHALSKMQHDNVGQQQKVFDELQELGALISGICRDASGDQETIHSGKGDISKATAELDQVVTATEEATGQIMDSCEKIQDISSQIDNAKSQSIRDETMNIFEACSFQDITGQRIGNAVKALYEIEQRVDRLIEILSKDGRFKISHEEAADDRSDEEKLKNGPQMAEAAMTQDDIDRLLAE